MTTHAASQHLAYNDDPNNPRVSLSPEDRHELFLARRRKGITLKTIAWRIGIDPHLLARYQYGERRPPQAVLHAWRRELYDV